MKAQRTGSDPSGPASKKPRTTATATPTATDANTRLRTECALQIERAHEPRDILRVMEDLTPAVLQQWPELLPLLARRVVHVCRNDLAVLQQAIEFCLPADLWKVVELDAAQPTHPWGDQAEKILLLWIEQAEGIQLPAAQAVLWRVALHLQTARQQALRDYTEANPACADALRTLKERAASLEGLPGDALRHVVQSLHPGPDRSPASQYTRLDEQHVNEVRQRALACARVCLPVALVNHAAHQELLPLLQQAWGGVVAAELEGIALDSFPNNWGKCPPLETATRMQAHLQAPPVTKQLAAWGPSAWPQMFPPMHAAFFDSRLGDSLLIALFAQDDRERTLQVLGALLGEALWLLDDTGLSDTKRKALRQWPVRLLALVYQKWLAPEEETFKRLIDLTLAQAHRLRPAERIYLLLELAALSLADAPRWQAVLGSVDTLRHEARNEVDWVLVDDCLGLLQNTPGQLSDERIDAIKRYLCIEHCLSPAGAAFALVISAIARHFPASRSTVHLGILQLMRDASDRQKDEPMPRLYGLMFSLFSTQDMLQVLERWSGSELILSQFLHPPTQANLPLWSAMVVRSDVALTIVRRELKAAIAETDDADLSSKLQALQQLIA